MNQNKINVIIIDDEPNGVETLSLLLTDYHDDVKVLATARNIKEAKRLIGQYKSQLDLIFLDIQMPGGDGFALLNQLTDISFSIVFTTAYDQYAMKAIKYAALDYLLKPIDHEELSETLMRFRRNRMSVREEQINLIRQQSDRKKVVSRLAIPTQFDIVFIPIDEIIYLESDSNYSSIFLMDGSKVVSSKNIGHYEELLSPGQFFRIHNSYIVNVKCIKRFVKGKTGMIELGSGKQLEVSLRRKPALLELLGA